MGALADILRDAKAKREAKRQYAIDALRHIDLARQHKAEGHVLFARRHDYVSRLAERAAKAEWLDPEPR